MRLRPFDLGTEENPSIIIILSSIFNLYGAQSSLGRVPTPNAHKLCLPGHV